MLTSGPDGGSGNDVETTDDSGHKRAARVLAVAAAVGFVAARAVPFARARVGLDLDSFDYLDIARHRSVFGVLGAHRPPAYLLVLKAVAENRQLVTWVQVVAALTAWILLAFATARRLRTRPGQFIGYAAVLLLASTLDLSQWDRVIGTESLSITLGVLIVTAALWWWSRWSAAGVAALCALVVCWALMRDANALVAGVGGLALVGVALFVPRAGRKGLLVMGIVAVVAAIGAVASSDAGSRWQQPIQNVITFRVLTSPERTDYFLRRGLPVSPVEAARIRGRCVNPAGAFLCEKVTDPAFYDWIDHHARAIYVRSWFAFPATTLWEPFAHVRDVVGTRAPVAEITGTQLHASYAGWVEDIVFPRSPRVLLAWVALLAVGAVLLRSRLSTAVTSVAGGLIVLTPVHLWVVWTGDAVELERHGLGAALQLQLGLLLLTVAVLDALLCRFASRPATRRGPR